MKLEIAPYFTENNNRGFLSQIFQGIDVSHKTHKDYLFRIGRFIKYVKERGAFDRNTLLEFKRSLSADLSISVATKNKYLIVSKVFVQQLYRLGILKIDLSTGVKSFRVSQGFKANGFTEEEIAKVIQGMSRMEDTRLKAILALKMFAGLRDIEIVRLQVENVNLTDEVLSIHGKGRDGVEHLPVVPQVVQVLGEYLKATGKKSGFLFTSLSLRNQGKGLTTKTIWLLVRGYLNSLGIKRNPHQFRSFFTTELVKKMGGNLFDVIPFTRHQSIQTLQAYVNQIEKEKVLPQYRNVFNGLTLN